MMYYYELSPIIRDVCGICAIFLMVVAMVMLVTACERGLGIFYVSSAAILAAGAVIFLQGLTDVNFHIARGTSLAFLADVVGDVPWFVTVFLMSVMAVLEIILYVVMCKKKKEKLTPGAIKESLDALPDGICFFSEDGQPLLVNMQMNRMSAELFQTEILNAELFWQHLKERREENVDGLIHTGDGKVWDFRRDILKVGRVKIHEMVACDVTKQWHLSRELEERNQSLKQVNERLHQYNREIERITAEDEILAAKRQVHDDVGRSLLAFRSYLEQPGIKRERENLLFLWRYTIAVMRHEAMPEKDSDTWEMLLQAARAVDVEILCDGQLPEKEKERAILIAALHECLTNTVKHANGSKLYLSVRTGGQGLEAELQNDGTPPQGLIEENGGLKDLRHTVETAGGQMTIESTPRFVLHIELPKGEDRR